jgi:hypothetical protein
MRQNPAPASPRAPIEVPAEIAAPPDTPPPDTALSGPVADAIERWWTDNFPGSPVAQVTQAWNHAFAAKEDLKRRLATLVDGGH